MNHFRLLDELEQDEVIDWFGLTHCNGPADQFEADGTVVMCMECCNLATL